MLLGEILHRSVIKTDLQSADPFSAIRELVDVVVNAGDIAPEHKESVIDSILAREKSTPTGMEMGLALPHGSSIHVENLFGALGISKAGIDFGCLDGKPAHLIMLLVLPRNEFQVHVRTLAGISHLLNEDGFRETLLNSGSADAILKLIRSEERGSIFDGFRRRFR